MSVAAYSLAERAEIVRSRVRLDGETLVWKISGRTVKLRTDKWGYHAFCVPCPNGAALNVFAHRALWLLHYGRWPVDQLDHVNHNRSDNRIANLREVNAFQNMNNRRSNRRGVSIVKRNGHWRAWIGVSGKSLYLGDFRTREAALDARLAAEARFAHLISAVGQSPAHDARRDRL